MFTTYAALTRRILGLLLTTSTLIGAFAQTTPLPSEPLGTWFIGTLSVPGGPKKWGGFAEVQGRSNTLFREFFYYELKGGISYDLSPSFTFTLAGGRYATYDYKELTDGPLNTEKRFWQQLVINHFLDRLRFEHRYRVEQRWFTFRDDSQSFRNRIRYRLNMFLPVNKRTITSNTFFLSAFDEIFLNPTGPTFERNRLYAGIGYQLNNALTLQLGWVNQTNYNPASFEKGIFTPQSASAKNNVVIQVTYRIARRQGSATPPEKLPSQQD
ncbi:hypothetical protein GCM10023189_59400 [Nibrella saemangeumensis]|uniref:DUF2490 domain-containing protein n=1 Tax=Nibrella saemangeumensis TaxID=1084526 RepID=A0ABP8NT07_9BACT